MSHQDHVRSNSQKIETTVGDLVAAVAQIALEAGRTEVEGYRLASLTLDKILDRSPKLRRTRRQLSASL